MVSSISWESRSLQLNVINTEIVVWRGRARRGMESNERCVLYRLVLLIKMENYSIEYSITVTEDDQGSEVL